MSQSSQRRSPQYDHPTASTVCARCGELVPLPQVEHDEVLFAEIRRTRPGALFVPLVCRNRRRCAEQAAAKQRVERRKW